METFVPTAEFNAGFSSVDSDARDKGCRLKYVKSAFRAGKSSTSGLSPELVKDVEIMIYC